MLYFDTLSSVLDIFVLRLSFMARSTLLIQSVNDLFSILTLNSSSSNCSPSGLLRAVMKLSRESTNPVMPMKIFWMWPVARPMSLDWPIRVRRSSSPSKYSLANSLRFLRNYITMSRLISSSLRMS